MPPRGTDGDLDNEWPAMAAPAGWVPQAGTCADQQAETLGRLAIEFKDCAQEHRYEIIHVGTVGESALPPGRESERFAKAWSECDAKASEFLGGPWRERKVRIAISVPRPAAWEGGARWYACQLNRYERLNDVSTIKAGGSLKGKFADPQIQFGCHQVDAEGEYVVKSCAEPHNSEFVGIVDWNGSWESLVEESKKKEGGQHHELCRRLIGTFVGVANIRTGTWVWLPAEADWEAGDRTLRCHFYLDNKTVSSSMKGVGAKGWPIK